VKASFFVVGIAAVVLAGCGGAATTATASSGSARTSPSPGSARGGVGNGVGGQVVEATSGKLVVSAQSGSVTVTYSSSTSVLQSGTGSLADLAPGTCVSATGQGDATGALTATTVSAMLNMNGVCSQAGNGGPGASPRPSGFPSANPNAAFVRGQVASASGSTITVQPATGASVTVNVPSTARITRIVSSSTARLAVGECVTASGTRTSSGSVQARSIVISAPGPNGCATGFAGGGRRGGASPGTTQGG
jgi:hypothetical protein